MSTIPDFNGGVIPTTLINQITRAVNMLGFVSELTDITSNTPTAGGTVEIAQSSIQFIPVSGGTYEIHFDGCSESSVTGDSMAARLRWSHTGSVGITGTEIGRTQTYADTANHTVGNLHLTRTFVATASTTVTVVATIQRASGTGAVKMNATVCPLYFRINCVKSA